MAKYDRLQTIGLLFSVCFIIGSQVNTCIAQHPVNAPKETQTIQDSLAVWNTEQTSIPTDSSNSTHSTKDPVQSTKVPVQSPNVPVESPKVPVESPQAPVQSPNPHPEQPPHLLNQPFHHPSSSPTGYKPLNPPYNAYPPANKGPPLPPPYPPISQHSPPSIPNGYPPPVNQYHHPVPYAQIQPGYNPFYPPAYPYISQYPAVHQYPAAHPPAPPPPAYYPPQSDVQLASLPQPQPKSIDMGGEFYTLEDFLRRQHLQSGRSVLVLPAHYHLVPPQPNTQQIMYRDLQHPQGYPPVESHSSSVLAQRNVAHAPAIPHMEISQGSVVHNQEPTVQSTPTEPGQNNLVDVKLTPNEIPRDAVTVNQEHFSNTKHVNENHQATENVHPMNAEVPQGLPVIPNAILIDSTAPEKGNMTPTKSLSIGIDTHSQLPNLPEFQQHPIAQQKSAKGMIINSMSTSHATDTHNTKTDLPNTIKSTTHEELGSKSQKSLVEVLQNYNPPRADTNSPTSSISIAPIPTPVPIQNIQDQSKSMNLDSTPVVKTSQILTEDLQSVPSQIGDVHLTPKETSIHQHPNINEKKNDRPISQIHQHPTIKEQKLEQPISKSHILEQPISPIHQHPAIKEQSQIFHEQTSPINQQPTIKEQSQVNHQQTSPIHQNPTIKEQILDNPTSPIHQHPAIKEQILEQPISPFHQHPAHKEQSQINHQQTSQIKTSTQSPDQQLVELLSKASKQELTQLLSKVSVQQLSLLLSKASDQQNLQSPALVSNHHHPAESSSPKNSQQQPSIEITGPHPHQPSQLVPLKTVQQSAQESKPATPQQSTSTVLQSPQNLSITSPQETLPVQKNSTQPLSQLLHPSDQQSPQAPSQKTSNLSPSPEQLSRLSSKLSPSLLQPSLDKSSMLSSSPLQPPPEQPSKMSSKLLSPSLQTPPEQSSKLSSIELSKQSLTMTSHQQQQQSGNISQANPSSQQRNMKSSVGPTFGAPNKLQTIEIPSRGGSQSNPGYVRVIYIPGSNDSLGKPTGFFRVIHVSVPTVSRNKATSSGIMSKGAIGLIEKHPIQTSPMTKSELSPIQKYLGLSTGHLEKAQNSKIQSGASEKSTLESITTKQPIVKVKAASESLPEAMKRLIKVTGPVQALNKDQTASTASPIYPPQPKELHSASLLNAKLRKYMQFVKLQQQGEEKPQPGRVPSRSKTEQYLAFLTLHEKQVNPQLQAPVVPTSQPFPNKNIVSSGKSIQSGVPEQKSSLNKVSSQPVPSSGISKISSTAPAGGLETMIAHSGVDQTSKLLNRTEPITAFINRTKVEEAIRQKHSENIFHMKNSSNGPNTRMQLDHLTLGNNPSQTNQASIGSSHSTSGLNSAATSLNSRASDTLPSQTNDRISSESFPPMKTLNPHHYQTNSYMTTYRHIIVRENGSVPIPRLPNETSDLYGNPNPIPNQFPAMANSPVIPRGGGLPGSLSLQTQYNPNGNSGGISLNPSSHSSGIISSRNTGGQVPPLGSSLPGSLSLQTQFNPNGHSGGISKSSSRNVGRATIISNMANPVRHQSVVAEPVQQHQSMGADPAAAVPSDKSTTKLNNNTVLSSSSPKTVKLSARFNLQANKFIQPQNRSRNISSLLSRNVIKIPGNISLQPAHGGQVAKNASLFPDTVITDPTMKLVSSPPETNNAAAKHKASHIANHPVIPGSHPDLIITRNTFSAADQSLNIATPNTSLNQASSPKAPPTASQSQVSISTAPPTLPSSTAPPTTTAPPFPADLMCGMQSDCEVGCCYTMSGEILWDWKFMMNPPPPANQVGYCHVKTTTLAGDSCHEQLCPCAGGNQVCSSIPPANFTVPAGFDPTEAGPMSFGKCYENGPQVSMMSHLEKAKQLVDLCMIDPACPLYQPPAK